LIEEYELRLESSITEGLADHERVIIVSALICIALNGIDQLRDHVSAENESVV
jgi:hypothetical protein